MTQSAALVDVSRIRPESASRIRPESVRTGRTSSAPGVDPRSDVELALDAQSDVSAFAVLYERYRTPIYRMVHSRLRNHEVAEDVTSEVFIKALRAIDGYRPTSAPFWGWLYRIAANAVVDHVRARRFTTNLDAAGERPDPSIRVEEEVIKKVEVEEVWNAVSMLQPAQRTAVTLRLGEDLPISHIASHMQRSEGAVKQLLNRGMASVRAQVAPSPAAG